MSAQAKLLRFFWKSRPNQIEETERNEESAHPEDHPKSRIKDAEGNKPSANQKVKQRAADLGTGRPFNTALGQTGLSE
ncbi:MAG TPA: hypothetical protein VJZ71_14570 [Phycisphaerae bacterium]|nr:hypothetical protein [Phycisphaerae bacterium]